MAYSSKAAERESRKAASASHYLNSSVKKKQQHTKPRSKSELKLQAPNISPSNAQAHLSEEVTKQSKNATMICDENAGQKDLITEAVTNLVAKVPKRAKKVVDKLPTRRQLPPPPPIPTSFVSEKTKTSQPCISKDIFSRAAPKTSFHPTRKFPLSS